MRTPWTLYNKKPVVVRAVLVTVETGQAIADEIGGRWKLQGLAPGDTSPQLWMPKGTTGLPIAFARTREYEGDHVVEGVCGELYVSRPETFKRAYERAAEILPPAVGI